MYRPILYVYADLNYNLFFKYLVENVFVFVFLTASVMADALITII